MTPREAGEALLDTEIEVIVGEAAKLALGGIVGASVLIGLAAAVLVGIEILRDRRKRLRFRQLVRKTIDDSRSILSRLAERHREKADARLERRIERQESEPWA